MPFDHAPGPGETVQMTGIALVICYAAVTFMILAGAVMLTLWSLGK